jgi:predicted 3-demethylubiquinone-9 3-methyltransferase (glyoxalase superfamily)
MALMELGEYPFSEKYGWVQDRYGLSWQIVPTVMKEMLEDKDKEKTARVTEACLKMKKFDIDALKRAYEGNS